MSKKGKDFEVEENEEIEDSQEECWDEEESRRPIMKYMIILLAGILIGLLSADTTIGQWTTNKVESGIGAIATWVQQGAQSIADSVEKKPKKWTDEVVDFFDF